VFLQEALRRVGECGLCRYNLDSTPDLERDPRLDHTRPKFVFRVAALLGIPEDCVGLKAKTPEGLNTDNAAVAHVVCCCNRPGKRKSPR